MYTDFYNKLKTIISEENILVNEPMSKDNPLGKIKDSTKLFITPHMGWGSYEARVRCSKEVYKNIEAFLAGEQRNVV